MITVQFLTTKDVDISEKGGSKLTARLNELLADFAPEAEPLKPVDVMRIIAQNELVVVKDDSVVIGMAVLVAYRTLRENVERTEELYVAEGPLQSEAERALLGALASRRRDLHQRGGGCR